MLDMVSITLSEKLNEELDAIIEAGYYDNRSELIREALRTFFSQKPEMRLVIAIELYRKGRITISRAAEIAGIPFETMISRLADERVLKRGRNGTRAGAGLAAEMRS